MKETWSLNTTLVPESENGSESPWFLFNDFVVQNVSEEEVLSFPGNWKARFMLV